ncbi:MAG TPA: tripartite tricarboxylate transporter TctB family protein [Burkholderiaceae bacterium]|nr:tripartite tricarboxylate transporter TctB family protein [Burkholderiaceae bacterium]
MRIHNQKDFWSGVLFVAAGVAFAVFAQEYQMGNAQRMGPAFFPTVLGGLLAILGVIVGVKGLAGITAEGRVEKFHFDALGWVLGGVVLFGLLLRPAGLIGALVVLIVVSALGSHEFRWKETAILAAGLMLLVLAVFIRGLKLTIPILPALMQH